MMKYKLPKPRNISAHALGSGTVLPKETPESEIFVKSATFCPFALPLGSLPNSMKPRPPSTVVKVMVFFVKVN